MTTDLVLHVEKFDIDQFKSKIEEAISTHELCLKDIHETHSFFSAKKGFSLHHFFSGNKVEISDGMLASLMNLDGAIASLNASSWSRVINICETLDSMPAERRNKWNQMIRDMNAPNFTRELVYETIEAFGALYDRFFAERIDGVFRALSGDHVTNEPRGFGKRMIFNNAITDWKWGWINYDVKNYINDFRVILHCFYGEDVIPSKLQHGTEMILKQACLQVGEWMPVDGNMWRIRVYKKGTAHIEIHPDIAWKLNKELAKLHPTAIPSEFRQKPKKLPKEFSYLDRIMPFAVRQALLCLDYALEKTDNVIQPYRREKTKFWLKSCGLNKEEQTIFDDVLIAIGAVIEKRGTMSIYCFEFDAMKLFHIVYAYGRIPDHKSYQFYPTPQEIVDYVLECANISHGASVLEPSAGSGRFVNAIRALNRDLKITAVELEKIRATALSEAGCCDVVMHGDFMKMEFAEKKFDYVIMNPPFRDGQAVAHVKRATELLTDSGTLFAVVPTSFKLDSAMIKCESLKTFDNAFDRTSIPVKVVKINWM
jgi:protein-L-isoaspartate O-methyltransferase